MNVRVLARWLFILEMRIMILMSQNDNLALIGEYKIGTLFVKVSFCQNFFKSACLVLAMPNLQLLEVLLSVIIWHELGCCFIKKATTLLDRHFKVLICRLNGINKRSLRDIRYICM